MSGSKTEKNHRIINIAISHDLARRLTAYMVEAFTRAGVYTFETRYQGEHGEVWCVVQGRKPGAADRHMMTLAARAWLSGYRACAGGDQLRAVQVRPG